MTSYLTAMRDQFMGREIEPAPVEDMTVLAMPTVSGRKLYYPKELAIPIKRKIHKTKDPFAYLGKIGYKNNTWRQKEGPLKIYQNLYLGFSLKKTADKETARRMILAESWGGLPRDVDDDSYVSTAQYYYNDHKGPDRTQNRKIHKRKYPLKYYGQ